MVFPTTIDTYTAVTGSTTVAGVHAALHTAETTTLAALQAKVGVDSSAVTTSLDYKLKNTSSIDPGHKHTSSSLQSLSSLTLTTPTITGGTISSPTITGATISTPTINNMTVNVWDGWIGAFETWTYASATTFTVSGDVTTKYSVGDKIKLDNSTTKYFYIVALSYSSPNTTITINAGIDYTLVASTISNNYYSKGKPQSFPSIFNYTPTVTGQSGAFTTVSGVGEYKLIDRTVFFNVLITITLNGTAAGGVVFTHPLTGAANFKYAINGQNTTNGTTLTGIMGTATTSIKKYDNSYPGADSTVLSVNGKYEI